MNFFGRKAEGAAPTLRQPEPPEPPSIPGAEIGAAYSGQRMGGDFFDFLLVNARLVFLMLDVSGQRDSAQNIAAIVQDHFRTEVPRLFAATELNEAMAIVELALSLTRTVLEAPAGIFASAALFSGYDPRLGTACYRN